MEKYLVNIEFRYQDKVMVKDTPDYVSKTITIGVYDDFDEACVAGNNMLEVIENNFKRHTFPGGQVAEKERFSRTGGIFNTKSTLITNMAYLCTPFTFFARVETLQYIPIEAAITDVLAGVKRYKNYKSIEDDTI